MSEITQDAEMHSEHPQSVLNREAAEAFAAAFSPALNVVACQNINNQPVRHGFFVATHDPETEIGVSAFFWGKGHFRAFVEVNGYIARAPEIGAMMANVLRAKNMVDAAFAGDDMQIGGLKPIEPPFGSEFCIQEPPTSSFEDLVAEVLSRPENTLKHDG